jgi:hypothetical protein
MGYTVRLDSGEENISIGSELQDYIEQHDELRIDEPDGAIGIVEAGTIIIAVSASYNLATSLIRDINNLLPDSETVATLDDVEDTAKWYISEHTSTEVEELSLEDRTSSGTSIEMTFSDQQNREHDITISRYDTELEHVNYSSS